MTLLLTGLFGGVVILVALGIHNQEAIRREWELVLAPWGRDAYGEMERRLSGEARMAEYAYQKALLARAAGSAEEATRFLEVGLRVIERTSTSWITFLRGMTVISRMVSAVTPIEPLRPGDFRLYQLSTLAFLGALLHRALVTTAERFRLRAYVLRQGFGIATRLLWRATRRIHGGQGASSEWDRIAAARADLRTLSSETLRTFHGLLVSLAAGRRA